MIVLPNKDGWYWIQIGGYIDGPEWFPCWFVKDSECFLPGGMGDDSSNGIYIDDDILQVGPEIIEPN